MHTATAPLVRAASICFVFFLVELGAGWWCGSLAILSDAVHMFTDVVGYAVAIVAVEIGSWPATQKYTFGFARVELIGALISLFLTWNLVFKLIEEAIGRLSEPREVHAQAMFVTAIFGVCANLFMALMLQDPHGDDHGHSHLEAVSSEAKEDGLLENCSSEEDEETGNHSAMKHTHAHSSNINVQAAMIHIIGDLLGSVSILIAALTLLFRPQWTIIDPLCTIFFSLIIFAASLGLVKQYVMILMETTPETISVQAVTDHLLEIPGITAVPSLRIWSLTHGKDACIARIEYNPRLAPATPSSPVRPDSPSTKWSAPVSSSRPHAHDSASPSRATAADVTLYVSTDEEMEMSEVVTLNSDCASVAEVEPVQISTTEHAALLSGVKASLTQEFQFAELFVELHVV
ncbi:cation efflux family-domain-containing protein [Chytriomyces cf. hyalinus JEL632]|nr:cation efflux family-domain-containing protein [Chytriomyces cf. hyalinus JEL632]